jgi:hypothetical protein
MSCSHISDHFEHEAGKDVGTWMGVRMCASKMASMACNQIIPSQISKFSTIGKSQFTNSFLLSALKHGSTNLCKVLNS